MEDVTTEHLEHHEHAKHAAESGDPLLTKVSATIALLAVVAATIGSLETIESGTAISKKSESVLVQNRATDRWSYFQAQSVKKNMYDIAKAAQPDRAAAYEAKARDYESEGEETKAQAEKLDRESDALRFTTNVGDETLAGPDNPIRVEIDGQTGEPAPYVHVRRGLEARLTRPVFYELVDMAEERAMPAGPVLGVESRGMWFPLGPTGLL